ncbi:MAG: hypothetical protein JWM68_4079, partial [Verrucomicrobiales bacterium]|nr:hypothetical protein [Verrucomicrobiales bacterium]
KKKTMKTNNDFKNSELKNRTAQHCNDSGKIEKTQLPRIDFRRRWKNRHLPTEGVLQLLKYEAPRFLELAQVVGKWIWIKFESKQPSTITVALSELGFHWNKKRKLWQHPCGVFFRNRQRDARRTYHGYFPADIKPA